MAADVKPKGIPKILSCSLFAHEAGDFEKVHYLEAPGTGVQRFVVLGRFDLLVLQVSTEMPAEDDQRLLVTNARVASNCTYLAHVIGEPEFDPHTWSQTHPLLGYCSLRLARQALKVAGSFDFVRTYLQEKLGERDDLRWVVASGTGWEDVIVLFFGRDFNEIMRAIGVLRSMDKNALPDPFQAPAGMNHLILTSCTQPAIALDSWKNDWSPLDTQNFLKRVKADEPLNWAVRVETYPGHWGGFVKELEKEAVKERAKVGLDPIPVKLAPLFGQADLRITPALEERKRLPSGEIQEISPQESKHATHRGLLTFLMEVMYKLEKGSTAIRTVETRLIPVRDGYEEDVHADFQTTSNYEQTSPTMLDDFNKYSTKALAALGTPPHSLGALKETLTRIASMAGDRLHGEEFGAIAELAKTFVQRTSSPAPESWGSSSEHETLARDTLQDISDWQMNVERCLADRFRGPYPAGDSLMVRLGSHAGAHLRFLVVMDHFAQLLYDMARGHMNRRRQPGQRSFCQAALATFIGNSPSAYATGHLIRRLGCGFTDVPAHMVGRLQESHVVAHETGHHFYRAFLCSFKDAEKWVRKGVKQVRSEEKDKAKKAKEQAEASEKSAEQELRRSYPSKEDLTRDVREILADLFASHTCFPNDADLHKDAAGKTIRAYYEVTDEMEGEEDPFFRSVLADVTLRMFAIQALIKGQQAELKTYDSLVAEFLWKLLHLTSEDDPRLEQAHPRLKERISFTRLALTVIARLRAAHPEFETFLSALADCAHSPPPAMHEIDRLFLKTFRDFMTRLDAKAGESLITLDRLWFMVLQSPSQSKRQLG